MRRLSLTLTLVAGLAATTTPTIAAVQIGDPAPAFTKARLGGGTASLSDFAGQVVVLFLFGYSCPVCIGDGPAFDAGIHQYYAAHYPGQVQVLGVDSWNGTANQVANFRDQTGAGFPLLLNGASATGGNFDLLYGPWDNYVVVNKQGIVRYHAANRWPHGNRLHLDELRGAVDSLVGSPLVVGDPPVRDRARLAASPNPFRGALRAELSLPAAAARARVALHDVTGRRVATLHDGPLPAGASRLEWNAAVGVASMAPGVYLLAAEVDGLKLHRRVVRLP